MIIQVIPVAVPVNWTKVVNFAKNSVFGKLMAEIFLRNSVSTFYCIFWKNKYLVFIFEVHVLLNNMFLEYLHLPWNNSYYNFQLFGKHLDPCHLFRGYFSSMEQLMATYDYLYLHLQCTRQLIWSNSECE